MNRNKKKVEYTDEPLQMGNQVVDFLPTPETLSQKEELVEIKVPLSHSSVSYLKSIAKKTQTSYQSMIRSIVERYITLQSRDK